jgi:hypothetical protein
MKYICKSCGHVQERYPEQTEKDKSKNQICNRCHKRELHNFGTVIRLYYFCSKEHYFKVSESLAKYVFRFKYKISCPICGNTNVKAIRKIEWRKNTGRMKKINPDVIQKPLFEAAK